jgi:hypothetical protein
LSAQMLGSSFVSSSLQPLFAKHAGMAPPNWRFSGKGKR